MNNLRKTLLFLFAFMAFGQTAWAQSEWPKVWTSGGTTCTLTADSVFTVTPTNGTSGAMADYTRDDSNPELFAPWYQIFSKIKTVIFEDGVTHVGNSAFNLSYYAFYNSLYNTGDKVIKLDTVSIGNDVVSIGDEAFTGCKFQSINIPDNVVTIGSAAFYVCSSAVSIHIGNGVTTLGSNAFANCDDVQNLYIGQSVTTLGEDCFHWSCFNADIECHAAPFGTWVSSNSDFTDSPSSPSSPSANNGRFHVAYADYIDWVTAFPNTGCVFIPDLDTQIHWTSGDCELDLDGYGTLTISGSGAMADYATPADCPWNNADIISKVNRVIVEDGVTTLSNNGFTGFTNVTDVIFHCDALQAWPSCNTDFSGNTICYVNYSWTGLYANALAQFHFNCGYGLDWNLETNGTLTISKTLPGSGLFYDYQNAEQLPWYDHVGEISDVVLGEGVLDIGSYVFSGINASTITIAETVTHIKGHAFDGSPIQFFTVPTSVTQIDAYAFANSGLYTFEIPSFMTQIPEGLFKDCQDLTRVTFNEGITSIGKNAFYNAGLTEVDLPSTLTTIGENAFANTSFAEITIPASLTTIGANAFNGCTNVTDISCYVFNPNSLTWTSSTTDFSAQTSFHVVTGTAAQWRSKFPNALVNFVEDTYDPEHPYEIYTSSDWNKFCNMVKNVSTQINAKLMADVNIGNLSNMVGTGSKKYSGTFDGNGHTLTFNKSQDDATTRAPFLNIEGAHIKNLHTAGYLRTGYIEGYTISIPHNVLSAKHCSGLVSHVSGSDNQINNCQVSITLDIYHPSRGSINGNMNSNGDDYCGGLVGEIVSGAELNLSDCLFDGIIQYLDSKGQYTVPKPTKCGGFVGHNKGTVTISNSLFNPTDITFTGGDGNKTFVNNDGGTMSLNNCYYTSVLGSSQDGINVSSWSPWHIASGLGSGWTISSDGKAVPAMTEHTLAGEGTYGTPYQIADADDWAYLARMANGNSDITNGNYFKMTNDISTNIPMGCPAVSRPFRGHFDGDGNTLNVNINFSDDYTAPFGSISGATIEGLVVTGTVSGGKYSAGLIGTTEGANDVINTISNCKVSTAVTTSGNYAGGIMGHGNSVHNNISGCWFDGSITKASGTGSYAGALMGWCTNVDNQNVIGCFVTGTLSNFDHMGMNYSDENDGKVFGGTNCYHLLDPTYYNEAPHAYSITSGTQGMTISNIDLIVYNPVSGINYYNVGMTVDSVLYGGPNESFSLQITAPEGFTISNVKANGVDVSEGQFGYSVSISNTNPVDVVVTATLTLTGDPIHEINTVDDWNTFAYTVSNGCHNYSGETVSLYASLSVTEMVGTNAGRFRGTFNGNGNTLTFNANTAEQLCAPFRWIQDATIQNLSTTGTITTSNQMAAGIVGRAFGNCYLVDCHSDMEIISSKNGDGTHGGLVAVLNHYNTSEISELHFNRCVFDGKLLTTNSTTNCSGFVGFSHGNTIWFDNCLFAPAEVSSSMGACTFGRKNDDGTYYFTNALYATQFGTEQGTQAYPINANPADYGETGTGNGMLKVYDNGLYFDGVLNSATPGFTTEGNWSTASNWNTGSVPSASSSVIIAAHATIASGETLNQTGNIIQYGGNLIVEDGGQLITANAVQAMVKKNIAGYGSGTAGWNFIATPIAAGTTPSSNNGMMTVPPEDYDLYYYEEHNQYWRNYKNTGSALHPDFQLNNGQGYLYAHRSTGELLFEGTTFFVSSHSKTVDLEYHATTESGETNQLAGWNLVGNPFTYNAYVDKPYYKMNADGSAIEATPVENYTESGNTIAPCTGVLVKANGTGQKVTFSKDAPSTQSANHGFLQIALAEANTRGIQRIDKAIVSFNEVDALEKFYFGEQNANLYIPQGGKEYAIATVGREGASTVSTMPINFKAAKDGEYTISVKPKGVEMDYLHLIDNMTGSDVDLLAAASTGSASSYTFTAKTTDYESRFRLVFSSDVADEAACEPDAPFAYISNGEIRLSVETSPETSLQIVDIMGRVLVSVGNLSEDVSGNVSTSGIPAGIYVLRLINGNDVKTQKIIVR